MLSDLYLEMCVGGEARVLVRNRGRAVERLGNGLYTDEKAGSKSGGPKYSQTINRGIISR